MTELLSIERVQNGFVVTEGDVGSIMARKMWIAGTVASLAKVIADILEKPEEAEPPRKDPARPEPDVLELTTDMRVGAVGAEVVEAEPGHPLGPGTPGHKIDDDAPARVVVIEGHAEPHLNPSGSAFMAGARATLKERS